MLYKLFIFLKRKFREISFAHNSCFRRPVVLKLCAEHGSITTVLFAKNFKTIGQSDVMDQTDDMGQRNFTRFEFKMRCGQTICISLHGPMPKKWKFQMLHIFILHNQYHCCRGAWRRNGHWWFPDYENFEWLNISWKWWDISHVLSWHFQISDL